ncbi:MAG: hypothetical protein HOO06_09910 [Bdellovibrionaceae bacterium]|jgi:hypothetical protein|nr:hypothetical protein [Pseudobdellovibrionaceae bacterium]
MKLKYSFLFLTILFSTCVVSADVKPWCDADQISTYSISATSVNITDLCEEFAICILPSFVIEIKDADSTLSSATHYIDQPFDSFEGDAKSEIVKLKTLLIKAAEKKQKIKYNICLNSDVNLNNLFNQFSFE